MKKVKVLIIRTAGTNCDIETAFAFKKAGAKTELQHIKKILTDPKMLAKYHVIALPGGFTYGDDIASGKILANEVKYKLKTTFQQFIKSGKLIIGICNGFQVLAKSGLLPNIDGSYSSQEVTLSLNDSAKFEDRWVYLKPVQKNNSCVWTTNMQDVIYLPVAHAEGKFIPKNETVLRTLESNDQIVFKYCNNHGNLDSSYPANPNGSIKNVAGICDKTGRIFGLMPHPERHMFFTQHPFWTRIKRRKGDGFLIFENGIKYAKRLL